MGALCSCVYGHCWSSTQSQARWTFHSLVVTCDDPMMVECHHSVVENPAQSGVDCCSSNMSSQFLATAYSAVNTVIHTCL